MWRLVAFVSLLGCALTVTPAAGQSREPAWVDDARNIVVMYARGDHAGVIEAVDRFYKRYPLDAVTWEIELFRAGSHYSRGEFRRSLESFRKAVPSIERMDNVNARRYASVFFRIGSLHAREKEWTPAIAALEEGLRLEPQSVVHQLVLGELFQSSGDRPRAVRHFREVLSGLAPGAEARAVIGVKLERLGEASAPAVADVSRTLAYPQVRLRLLPAGPQDARVSLPDLCLLVQSKWWIGCEVAAPLAVSEDAVADYDRKQWNADRILEKMRRRQEADVPSTARPGAGLQPRELMVAIVTADIFGRDINFAYSWQNPSQGVGVLSTHRFVSELDEAYEPDIVATRRVGIQLLSTVGSLLGFKRATRPECPTAFPNDLAEFLMKTSRLCPSETEQRDALLVRRGGVPAPVTPEQAREMARVYGKYRFD